MASFPNLQSTTTFPSFSGCPTSSSPPSTSSHFLLATIDENMTFSYTPTIICRDRDKATFALKLKLDMRTEEGKKAFKEKKLKKETTVVVKGARRSGIKDGKQGFIDVRVDEVMIIPVPLERLLEMSLDASIVVPKAGSGGENLRCCQACGDVKGKEDMARCTGCATVWYCGKECQVKGWSEAGHKLDCKILKIVAGLDLGDRGLEDA